MLTFQQIILTLQSYWDNKGCALLQPIDMEVGAGTSHVHTFLRAIGPEPWRAAYVQPSRRPKDGRYGDNPNRLQHYYQYQVVLKPAPENILDLYLGSLEALGFEVERHVVPADAVAGAGDMLGVLLGIGSGEQQFGAVRMANLTVAPREHVERLAHSRSAAGH